MTPGRTRWWGMLLTTGALVGAASCGESAGPNTPKYLVVTPSAFWLAPVDSAQLTVAVLNRDSALLAGEPVVFSSGDTTLVRVSATGVAHSVGKLGLGQVTVTTQGLTANVPLQVSGSPQHIVVGPTDTTIREGASFQYRLKITDSLGDSIRYLPATYQLTDSGAVRVSAAGRLTGIGGGNSSVLVEARLADVIVSVVVQDTNVVARIPLPNAPYGVGATSGGVVYVAPIAGPAIHHVTLPGATLSDSVTMGAYPVQIAFTPAGDTAFVTRYASGEVGIIAMTSHTQVDSVAIPGQPYGLALGANGLGFVGTAAGGWVYKVDLGARSRVDSLSVTGGVFHMAMGPGDSLLYVALQGAGVVEEVRVSTMAVRRTFDTQGTVQAIAVDPHGAELYVANEAGPFRIESLTTGQQSDSVATRGGSFGVTVSPDGATLCVTTTAGFVYFLDRATHAVKHRVYVGGIPRLVRVDAVSGLAVVANEGNNEVDIVR